MGVSWRLETRAILDSGGRAECLRYVLMDIEAYNAIAACGGQAKPTRPTKTPKSGLKRQNHPLRRERKKKPMGIDMSGLPLGKTNRSQRENKAVRRTYRHKICQIPGCTKPAINGVHHIIQKVDIIIDHPLNFLNPCIDHHPECDEGIISQVDQFELKAHENNTTVEQILKDLGEFAGVVLFIDGERVKVFRG